MDFRKMVHISTGTIMVSMIRALCHRICSLVYHTTSSWLSCSIQHIRWKVWRIWSIPIYCPGRSQVKKWYTYDLMHNLIPTTIPFTAFEFHLLKYVTKYKHMDSCIRCYLYNKCWYQRTCQIHCRGGCFSDDPRFVFGGNGNHKHHSAMVLHLHDVQPGGAGKVQEGNTRGRE